MIRLIARLFTIVALSVGAGITIAPASTAVTAIVPNYFNCNWLGECRQTNGAFASGYPVYCHRVLFLSGVPNRRIGLCQRWV